MVKRRLCYDVKPIQRNTELRERKRENRVIKIERFGGQSLRFET